MLTTQENVKSLTTFHILPTYYPPITPTLVTALFILILQDFDINDDHSTVEHLCTYISLLRTVSNVPTKFSYIFFKKNLHNKDSL